MKKVIVALIILSTLIVTVSSQQPEIDAEKRELIKMNLEVVKLFNAKRYAEALPIAEKTLKLTEKVYGSTTIEMARAYGNLGQLRSFLEEKKNWNDFEKAVAIYKKIPNLSKEETDEFVGVLERFAILKEQKEFRLAESALEDAVQWREKVSGTKANQLIQTYFLLANINYWNKNFKKSALRYYRVLELIDINKKTVTEEAANMAYSRCRCAYVKAGRDTEIIDLETKFERDAPTDTSFGFIRFKGTVVNGKALNLFQPTYPEEAKRDLARGEVIVEVLIGKSGKVLSACAINKAHKALIETAEVAAMKSTFSPTTVNGEAKNVTGTIVYKFGV